MYCPDCGHNNPEGNRFCGMCGESLPERRRASEPAISEHRERVAQHDPEPVSASLRHREPIDEPVRRHESPRPFVPASVTAPPVSSSTRQMDTEYMAEPHLESATPIEQSGGMLSGPSFLGLGSTSDSSSGYSYLYEDEAPKSHAGLVVFLICLFALGGVLYWQWQPLKTWVVNKANSKVNTGIAPTQAPSTPGSSTASSDNANPAPSQPADQQAMPQNDSNAPANPPAKNNAAPTDKPSPDQSSAPPKDETKSEADSPDSPATTEAKKSETRKEPAKPVEEARASKREPAAREEKAAAAPAGDDLVASGERYLYGHGAPQNCGQAVVNFNAAAKQDNPRAMGHLGALYATGECVPLNRIEAYHWFSRALAKDRNNTYLEHNLSMLWREMDAQEKAQVSGEAKEAQNKMF